MYIYTFLHQKNLEEVYLGPWRNPFTPQLQSHRTAEGTAISSISRFLGYFNLRLATAFHGGNAMLFLGEKSWGILKTSSELQTSEIVIHDVDDLGVPPV